MVLYTVQCPYLDLARATLSHTFSHKCPSCPIDGLHDSHIRVGWLDCQHSVNELHHRAYVTALPRSENQKALEWKLENDQLIQTHMYY